MALSTLAEWTGSGIINNLVDKAFSFLSDRMLPADIEVELNRLYAVLPKITAVMRVAEALKLKYPNSGVDAWLEIFKVAFLAAEDVLDELEYQKLEDTVKSQDQVGASSSSILVRLKRKFCGSNINHDTLGRLREAVRMLDVTSMDVGYFCKLASGLHFYEADISSRETSCILNERNVVGRETEKAKIIEWLKKPVPHSTISAFCIVGAGGLGKTTLAQLISEEMGRENLFDKTIWACVSTNFSVEDITRKILQQLGESCHGGESLNSLQIKLKEMVHSKKLLFILDDVWNEDKMCDWEKLVAPLRFVHQGSKILLTTRMKSVADMLARVLNVEREYLDLCGLEEQQLLKLFERYAFEGHPNHDNDLQDIAKNIVKKLWGSPLAAKHDSGHHIDELKTLNNLKHLLIQQVENVGDPAQAKNANLYKKEIDNQTILLPPELCSLEFGDCGEIDVILLESASNHATLSDLVIVDSKTITYIPCSENAFASLFRLNIHGCYKLFDNSLMGIADGVNEENHVAPLRIEEIDISCLPLLSIEPLRSLRAVTICNIRHSLWMEALPEQWFLQNSNTLEELFIGNAPLLKSLPETIVRLTSLKILRIWFAFLLEQIPELPLSLVELEIGDAPMQSLPDTMVRLTALEELDIHGATSLQKIPDLPDSLVRLHIEEASSLRSLPDTMVRLTALEELDIRGATSLQKIPDLPDSLVRLRIAEASSLQSLPDTMVRLTALKQLDIQGATSLQKIPELPLQVKTTITGSGGIRLV
ncbi:Disease resistance protein RGA2 [Rhynchospora pubera]|uniref:Disease resistance protein RGA2 n=1 Tax=Rhynchospora pubera TaxID=906938 RepID=A0AAV8FBJ7_9POAL|nr:Disease resistance protein RGA2 [Rhynchospora pubera]